MVENEASGEDPRHQVDAWLLEHAEALAPNDMDSRTLSGLTVNAIYTELDAVGRYSSEGPDLPGRFPYTRGINPAMYREQLWVMGQYSGHGSAKETNKRIRSLLANGQKGFSVALDLPTQMGLDSDDVRSRGEIGRVGVPIDSVHDMVDLLQGIELDKVRQIRTTANAIGPLAVALFVVAAERLGYQGTEFKVMLQNDVLKEYVARGTYIFPPEKGLRFSADVIEYCTKHLPNWEPIEFCGYHIRDSGSNAVQEVAIAMANGLAYIDESIRRGLTIDDFGHSLFMFLSAHLDIFEEVAKFRAARTLWAQTMKERYGASDRAASIGIFTYTLGSPQTAQEPLNNIVRIAYQSLAAILGGVQTLATSAYDEAIQLPSEEAAKVSLRTQQILAYETGVPRTPDPLAGSYLVESLTRELMAQITQKLERDRRARRSSSCPGDRLDQRRDRRRSLPPAVSHRLGRTGRHRSQPVRQRTGGTTPPGQDRSRVWPKSSSSRCASCAPPVTKQPSTQTLEDLRRAAAGDENTLPLIIEAVRADATVGEVCSALREVWGDFVS